MIQGDWINAFISVLKLLCCGSVGATSQEHINETKQPENYQAKQEQPDFIHPGLIICHVLKKNNIKIEIRTEIIIIPNKNKYAPL